MERIRIKFKNLIKISKIRGRMSPPIPLVMRIIILFNWRMEYFLCLIGLKNSHPKINWRANHSQFSLALKGRGGHWLEGKISKLPLVKGNKLKEGHGCLLREIWVCCVGGRRREENECVRKRLVLMCGRVLFIKKMCARNKHGRISMTKPLEFCFK
jgi:hypothetical protein